MGCIILLQLPSQVAKKNLRITNTKEIHQTSYKRKEFSHFLAFKQLLSKGIKFIHKKNPAVHNKKVW